MTTVVRMREPDVTWKEYVWQCPWGHWNADNPLCGRCFLGDREPYTPSHCPDHDEPHRHVAVWHNISLRTNISQSHPLWEILERGAKEEPEITRLVCLHKRNFEIKDPSENWRRETVDLPSLP